jgi:transcriptional regulator with XRE-family HTH domain
VIGARVRLLRVARGWRQRDLAQRCDVAQSQVAIWETEKVAPSLTNLTRLADALTTSLDYLVGRTDNPTFSPRGSGEAGLAPLLGIEGVPATSPSTDEGTPAGTVDPTGLPAGYKPATALLRESTVAGL